MSAFTRTMLHTAEIGAILLVVYLAKVYFGLQNEAIRDVVMLLIVALVKFARTSDAVPVTDYIDNHS